MTPVRLRVSMSDDPRILKLLEEALDSELTPEEVCAECPELLAEVSERFEQCRRVEAQLEALFPSSIATGATAGASATPRRRRPHPAAAGLPQIPGYHVEALLGHGGMG